MGGKRRINPNYMDKILSSQGSTLQWVVVFSLLLLIVVQYFLVGYPLEILLNNQAKKHVESWLQNNPLAAVTTNTVESELWSTITIKADKFTCLTKARLLINGKHITDFRENPTTIRVLDGDKVEVDTSFYEKDLCFSIIAATEDIENPQINTQYQTENSKIEFTVKRNSTEVAQDG